MSSLEDEIKDVSSEDLRADIKKMRTQKAIMGRIMGIIEITEREKHIGSEENYL